MKAQLQVALERSHSLSTGDACELSLIQAPKLS